MFIPFKYKRHCLRNYFHDERIRMIPQMITYDYKTDKQKIELLVLNCKTYRSTPENRWNQDILN